MSASRPSLLLLPALAIATALLAGCAPGTPTPATPEPSESASSTPTPTPTETEGTDDGGDGTTPDPTTRANIIDAVSSGNTAALYDVFAIPTYVKYCASEMAGDVSDPAILVADVGYATSPTAVWDFNLPASLLDNYANNPGSAGSYVEDFPAGAIVGRSNEDKVISFVLTGDHITRLFICNSEYALIFE